MGSYHISNFFSLSIFVILGNVYYHYLNTEKLKAILDKGFSIYHDYIFQTFDISPNDLRGLLEG